jgi:acetyl-CoA synthetase
MSARIRARCLDGGVVPLQGQREALEALSMAGSIGAAWRGTAGPELHIPSVPASGPAPPGSPDAIRTLNEAEGKHALAAFGVPVPNGRVVAVTAVADTAAALGFPVVIKAVGSHLEHKSELGGVVVNVRSASDAAAAGQRLAALSDRCLVEAMITDGIAEILVGVVVDPQFGQVLVLGAGGVLAELVADTQTLLPPWTRDSIAAGLNQLSSARLLRGYRGKPAGDVPALIEAILGIARYAAANLATLVELDVNPVIVRPAGLGVMAVDTMIRLRKST